MTHSWISNLFGRTPRTVRKAAARRPLTMEKLEDRTLPSNPASGADLIAAIQNANLVAGPSTITLAPNTTFNFTSAQDPTDGGNALPIITGNIIIVGSGDTIERTGTTPFRLFEVAAGGSLTLQNLTLQGGLAQGIGSAAEGGAIYSSGTLSLTGVSVLSNTAQGIDGNDNTVHNHFNFTGGNGVSGFGGGVFVAAGALTLNNSTVQLNQALGGNGQNGNFIVGGSGIGRDGGDGANGLGGGLYVASGSVSLSNNQLSNNSASGGAGGNGGSGLDGGQAAANPPPTSTATSLPAITISSATAAAAI